MIARLLYLGTAVTILACASSAPSTTAANTSVTPAAKAQACRRTLTVANGSSNRVLVYVLTPGVQPRIVESVAAGDSTTITAVPAATYHAKFDASEAAPWVDGSGRYSDPRVRLQYGCE